MDAPTKTSTPGSAPKPIKLESLEDLGALLEKYPHLRGGQTAISVRGQEVWNSAKPELSDVEGVNARVRSAMSPPRPKLSEEQLTALAKRLDELPDDSEE